MVQNNKSLWCQTWNVLLCMKNSVISARITSFYGSDPSSVVLCIQKSDFRIRNAYLYWSHTSPVVLCIQKSDFRTIIACLYGSQISLVNLCMQNDLPSIRITSLYWSQPTSVVFGFITAPYGQNNKSLWVQDMKCPFVHANSVISARNTSLYVSQPSSVVLCIQMSDFRTRIACLYWSQTAPWFGACKTVCLEHMLTHVNTC